MLCSCYRQLCLFSWGHPSAYFASCDGFWFLWWPRRGFSRRWKGRLLSTQIQICFQAHPENSRKPRCPSIPYSSILCLWTSYLSGRSHSCFSISCYCKGLYCSFSALQDRHHPKGSALGFHSRACSSWCSHRFCGSCGWRCAGQSGFWLAACPCECSGPPPD